LREATAEFAQTEVPGDEGQEEMQAAAAEQQNAIEKDESVEKLQDDFYNKMIKWLEAKSAVQRWQQADINFMNAWLQDKNNSNLKANATRASKKLNSVQAQERTLATEQRKAAEAIMFASHDNSAKQNIDSVCDRIIVDRPDLAPLFRSEEYVRKILGA
jgi:hypothetical protein